MIKDEINIDTWSSVLMNYDLHLKCRLISFLYQPKEKHFCISAECLETENSDGNDGKIILFVQSLLKYSLDVCFVDGQWKWNFFVLLFCLRWRLRRKADTALSWRTTRHPQPLAVACGRKSVTEAASRLGGFEGNTECAFGKTTPKTVDTGV